MVNLQDITIENEVIAICDTTSFNAIGPGAVLRNCDLQIAVPARALSISGTIVGGTIHARRALHGFDWLNARLDGATFYGRFKNNRFGNFPPMYYNGAIANCDFSEATLFDALFLNTSCDGVVFGEWPEFTIKNSPEFHARVEQGPKSNAIWDYLRFLSKYINDYGDDSVTLNFMTLDAQDICKRENFDLSSFQNCLASVEGIVR